MPLVIDLRQSHRRHQEIETDLKLSAKTVNQSRTEKLHTHTDSFAKIYYSLSKNQKLNFKQRQTTGKNSEVSQKL